MDNCNHSENATQSRRNWLISASGIALMAVLPVQGAHAAKDPVYTSFVSNKAVGGFDPVAYFTEGKPVKGSDKFKLDYMGAEWLFASQEHLDTFQAEPEKYAPQYGGYCAYAVATGTTAKGDPEQWEIFEDKLYLNVNASIKKRWSRKERFLHTKKRSQLAYSTQVRQWLSRIT